MSIARLEAEGLACLRGQRLLFRELSFRLEAGQALIVEGPNGAGKSSLLRLVAGFLAPFAGTVTLQGASGAIGDAEERGKQIGWLGHLDGLKSQLTLRENLAFYTKLYTGGAGVEAALDWAGLSRAADIPAQYLSAGQKRRLSLARLKLSGRALWLLDEPLAALDSAGKKSVEDLLARHCAGGGMVLAATHEPLMPGAARLVLT